MLAQDLPESLMQKMCSCMVPRRIVASCQFDLAVYCVADFEFSGVYCKRMQEYIIMFCNIAYISFKAFTGLGSIAKTCLCSLSAAGSVERCLVENNCSCDLFGKRINRRMIPVNSNDSRVVF